MRPVLLLLVACATVGCADASLVVSNRSDFEIHELYVTQIENPSWGPNLLDTELRPGESFSVDVCCGTFDTMLVDETGAFCEVLNVELCFETDDWVIRNTTCRVFDTR
jgi:hypothetical protein